jgi:hypothetical protein
MAAFSFKRPLNALSNPIYPDVKKDILNFRNARRCWTVDAGTTVKQSQMYPFFVEDAIEFQSRNRNETMYGNSSHRSYVNEQVVYPLISPWDLEPLSRKPRTIVTPRVNPESPYVKYDRLFNGIDGYIEQNISTQR